MQKFQIIWHAPSGDNGNGYYTRNYGKPWFKKRQRRMRQQKQSRKANR